MARLAAPQGRRRDDAAVALVLALLAFTLAAGSWLWRADRLVYDTGLSLWTRPPPDEVVIVAIDDASIEAIGRWPWRRSVHATLLLTNYEELGQDGRRQLERVDDVNGFYNSTQQN